MSSHVRPGSTLWRMSPDFLRPARVWSPTQFRPETWQSSRGEERPGVSVRRCTSVTSLCSHHRWSLTSRWLMCLVRGSQQHMELKPKQERRSCSCKFCGLNHLLMLMNSPPQVHCRGVAPGKLRRDIRQHRCVRHQGRPREVRDVPEVRHTPHIRQVRLQLRGDGLGQLHGGQALQPGHQDRTAVSRVGSNQT